MVSQDSKKTVRFSEERRIPSLSYPVPVSSMSASPFGTSTVTTTSLHTPLWTDPWSTTARHNTEQPSLSSTGINPLTQAYPNYGLSELNPSISDRSVSAMNPVTQIPVHSVVGATTAYHSTPLSSWSGFSNTSLPVNSTPSVLPCSAVNPQSSVHSVVSATPGHPSNMPILSRPGFSNSSNPVYSMPSDLPCLPNYNLHQVTTSPHFSASAVDFVQLSPFADTRIHQTQNPYTMSSMTGTQVTHTTSVPPHSELLRIQPHPSSFTTPDISPFSNGTLLPTSHTPVVSTLHVPK